MAHNHGGDDKWAGHRNMDIYIQKTPPHRIEQYGEIILMLNIGFCNSQADMYFPLSLTDAKELTINMAHAIEHTEGLIKKGIHRKSGIGRKHLHIVDGKKK